MAPTLLELTVAFTTLATQADVLVIEYTGNMEGSVDRVALHVASPDWGHGYGPPLDTPIDRTIHAWIVAWIEQLLENDYHEWEDGEDEEAGPFGTVVVDLQARMVRWAHRNEHESYTHTTPLHDLLIKYCPA